MTSPQIVRGLGAICAGLAAAGACAGAGPEGEPPPQPVATPVHPEPTAPPVPAASVAAPEASPQDAGAVVSPDAAAPSPSPDAGAPDARADAAAAEGPPPAVEIADVSFEGGEVPTLAKSVEKLLPKIGKCVAERGGLSAAKGRLRVQMLVRSRERAEGVEVSEAKGISAEAGSCIRLVFKDTWVGTPTADFVEARVVLSFSPGKGAR